MRFGRGLEWGTPIIEKRNAASSIVPFKVADCGRDEDHGPYGEHDRGLDVDVAVCEGVAHPFAERCGRQELYEASERIVQAGQGHEDAADRSDQNEADVGDG